MPAIDSTTPYWISAFLYGHYMIINDTDQRPVPKQIAAYFPDALPPAMATASSTYPSVTGFTAAEQDVTMGFLEQTEQVIDVDFVKTTDPVVGAGLALNFFKAHMPGVGGRGLLLVPGLELGDVKGPPTPGLVAVSTALRHNTVEDGYMGLLMAHELCHALGMFHPEEAPITLAPQDLTYRWVTPSNALTWDGREGETFDAYALFNFRPLDIAALQFHYGPSQRVRTGNDVYALDEAGPSFIWDGVGNDAIDASGASQGATLYLTPGQWGHIGAKASYITAPGQVTVNYNSSIENLIGTRFADTLHGSASANTLAGGAGDDVLHGLGGGDTLDGGAGRDTAVLSGSVVTYTLARQGSDYTLQGQAGTSAAGDGLNRLLGIERLQFADGHVALDLSGGGNAELVARLIGSLLGAQHVSNAEYCGIGLWALDSGTYTFTRLVETVLGGAFGPTPDNGAVVDRLFTLIAGQLPSSSARSTFVGGLERGEYTQAQLVEYAAMLDATGTQIDLTGLQDSGLAYNTFMG